jgi:hypothetical protein
VNGSGVTSFGGSAAAHPEEFYVFGRKFVEKKIEQAGREPADAGAARYSEGTDPVSRTLGADAPAQLARATGMAARFGIHLDLADAAGVSPPQQTATGDALEEGQVEGSLHIVSCTAMDPRELRAPCHMNYVVQAPGIPAFAGEQVFEVWTKQWPNPGDDLPVVFDPRKPQKLKIQWDRLLSHADSGKLHAEQLAAQLNASGASGSTSPVPRTTADGTTAISPEITAALASGTVVTPIMVGSSDPDQIRLALLRAEQALGIDLNGDGKVGG